MDGALGGDRDPGESAEQALANLASTPTGVLTFLVQDIVFHLEGKLVGAAIGTPASIGQSLHPTFLVAIEDFVASLTGDTKLPAQISHCLTGQPASHELHSLIHYRTLLPRHHFPPPLKKGKSVT